MRKLVFAINITIDGFADHTAGIADDELHDFFTDLLDTVDISLMGRKTYQLMENYWPKAYEDPKATKSIIDFADKFNAINKIVFSNTLKEVEWKNSRLASEDLLKVVSDLKNQNGKNISAGSLSIANQLFNANLIDEFWFLIHPVVLGEGIKLFDGLDKKSQFQLIDIRKFNSGVVVLHYKNLR
ncbi:MAG: dihydrofolate reductase family protein [Ignavibacterium sp.]|nr:dihydrofolate reductase family protein [Ignavibacterium sp.]